MDELEKCMQLKKIRNMEFGKQNKRKCMGELEKV